MWKVPAWVRNAQTEWGGYYLYLLPALQQPPNNTPALTRALGDAGGRIRAAQTARASASYTLWITGDLLDNCWLRFSSVHCVVGIGHIMFDLKSNWDVLESIFWEAVETFLFCFAFNIYIEWHGQYWSSSFSELFIFILELNVESRELQYPQNPQLEITFRSSLKMD